MFVINNFLPFLKSQMIDIYERLVVEFNKSEINFPALRDLNYDSDRQ